MRSEVHAKFWSQYLEGRDRLEDRDLDERMLLKLVVKEQSGRVWTTHVGSCKHSEDPFGFIRSGERFTLNLVNTTVLVSHMIGLRFCKMLFYCISGCKRSFYIDAVEHLCYDSNLIIDEGECAPLFAIVQGGCSF